MAIKTLIGYSPLFIFLVGINENIIMRGGNCFLGFQYANWSYSLIIDR